MKSIECAFQGTLGRDPVRRVSSAGRDWMSFSIAVGEGDDTQWIEVACFGPSIDDAATLVKGDRAYVEGNLKLRTWQNNDGSTRTTLSVSARKVQPLGKIGQQRPKKPRAAKADKPNRNIHEPLPFDDELPI